MSELLSKAHRAVGRTRLGLLIAVKVRNQANAVIRAGLSDGHKMERNGESWLLSKVAVSGSLFVDVGANVGSWALAYAKQAGGKARGIMFEPSPDTAEVLRGRVSDAGILANAEVIEKAVAEVTGRKVFSAEPMSGETSSLVQAHSRLDATNIQVEVTTLDSEMAARGIDNIDMLKIDAEGYDLLVLKGASNLLRDKRIRIVQFEYNAPWALAGSTLADALSLLRGFGYSVCRLSATGLSEFDYDAYGEFFGYSNFVAFLPSDCRFS